MLRHLRPSLVIAILLAAVVRDDASGAGDPRPTADLPGGVAAPVERRPSRRALRRAARRGLPADGQPQTPTREDDRPAWQDTQRDEPPVTPSAMQSVTPISVDATLGSPFQPEASERPTVHRDQPYGTAADPRQRLDIYLPPGCTGGSLPLVVWIPGDEWQGGPRSDCPVTWLVERGYVVACVGYRPADAAIFPAQLDDCRAALATLVRDAEIWGIDRSRICVMGAGGGGQLAALVGSERSGQPVPVDAEPPPAVAAVCAIAAPSQLTTLGASHDRAVSAASRLVGGPLPELREAALAASPLTHISPDDPPTLIVHGTHDALIPSEQAVRLDRALAAAGADHTLVLLDAGHAIPLGKATPAATELVHFLDRVLGPGRHVEPAVATP
jgi:acetyl esterase/lipase